MKKIILYGLAGVLAMLLVQSPADLQAMDSGMMAPVAIAVTIWDQE